MEPAQVPTVPTLNTELAADAPPPPHPPPAAPAMAVTRAVQLLPLAEASHDEVVADPELFWKCLRSMWEKLNINEKVPRIGKRELDMHMLYCNVTSLGGCERVIQRKHWREAASSFHFPDTITSVSYSLRKAYVAFLWDFEQVYFFHQNGPRIPPPQPQKLETSRGGGEGGGEGKDPESSTKKRKAASHSHGGQQQQQHQDVVATSFVGLPAGTPTQLTAFSRASGSPEASVVGSRGVVLVDSRFDCGYFVTVRLGHKHEFKGTLYFPPPEHTTELGGVGTPHAALSPSMRNGMRGGGRGGAKLEPGTSGVGGFFGDFGMPLHGGSTSKAERGKDPHAPKPNKTPFNFFSVDARHKAKEAFPHLPQTDITKKVGEMWQKATEEEKAPYIAMSNQDKARYQSELEWYNYRLAAQAAHSQAMHAANAVSAAQAAMAEQPLMVGGQVLCTPRQQEQQQQQGHEQQQQHGHGNASAPAHQQQQQQQGGQGQGQQPMSSGAPLMAHGRGTCGGASQQMDMQPPLS